MKFALYFGNRGFMPGELITGARGDMIKADIQGVPVRALRSSEGGLCGCAMLQAAALGDVDGLAEAREIFVRYVDEHTPKNSSDYEAQYERYQKIYTTIKELY